jgi:hypothetical protein
VPLTDEPTGQATWQRLKMCEEMLARPAQRADCVVWLPLAPTPLPQWEVTHGQVPLYNADYLSIFIGHPELADRFTVAPPEVLDPSVDPPILIGDEVEWERNYHMAYARVPLPDTVVLTQHGAKPALWLKRSSQYIMQTRTRGASSTVQYFSSTAGGRRHCLGARRKIPSSPTRRTIGWAKISSGWRSATRL